MKVAALLVLALALVLFAPPVPADESEDSASPSVASTSETEATTGPEAAWNGWRCDTCKKPVPQWECKKCGKMKWGCKECKFACTKKEPCVKCAKEYTHLE